MIGFIDTFFYNHLQQLTINGCLRLAPFLTGLRESSFFYCDWLGSDLGIGHFFSFRCPLVNTPQLNTQPSSTQLLNYFLNSLRLNRYRINYVSSLESYKTSGEPNRDHHLQEFLYYSRVHPLLRKRVLIYSNALVSTSLSVAAGTCLLSRYLTMDVSAVLLWLHTSGVQASCHNMYHNSHTSRIFST
jgi:hypothetical protein